MMMRCHPAFLITTAILSLGFASAASAQAPSAPAPAQRASSTAWTKEIPQIAAGEWNGPRLADGQPDVSGHWSNTIANHSNFTDPQAGPPAMHRSHASRGRQAGSPILPMARSPICPQPVLLSRISPRTSPTRPRRNMWSLWHVARRVESPNRSIGMVTRSANIRAM
jgi:hypothetical protein